MISTEEDRLNKTDVLASSLAATQYLSRDAFLGWKVNASESKSIG